MGELSDLTISNGQWVYLIGPEVL